jgi:hypothetical protein
MKQTKEGFCAIWPKPMKKDYSLLKYFMGLNANYIEMAISFMELPKSFPKIMPSYLMNLEH